MQDLNLFSLYIKILDDNNIPYFITGSVASIVYGDPRLTHDIDLVINLDNSDINKFINAFPPDQFYCPPEEVIRTEINRTSRGHFNLIHHDSGFKADIYLTGNSEFQQWAIQNSRQIDFAGSKINIAPIEYVIIMKLVFYKEGRAQKHILDIRSMINNSSDLIDYNLLQKLISEKGLNEQWNEVKEG
ncbi:MAG: hypothetical protein RBR74_05540 [Ignavibacteriaceae bacterium]|jgi:hypothetical protein|nr:hypothetical protein [Ignavibacteriaceae bacterium]